MYYIYNIIRMYYMILHLHGIYVAVSFLKYMLSSSWYYCNSIYEYFFPEPLKQLEN